VSRRRTVKGTVKGETPSRISTHTRENNPKRNLLRFGRGNAKLDDAIFTFSLPAGYSCPFARDCLSKANRQTGRIKDGPGTKFRCYAASMEMRQSIRRSRWHNFRLLHACKSKEEMTGLILASLTRFAGYVRVHCSGDFFSLDYFDAWLEVSRQRHRTLFYAYTKSLPYWVTRLKSIPNNFVLTASKGGQHDHLIEKHGLRYAQVVYSEAEAEALGLPIDHDDSHAIQPGGNFALLIHGTQPAGTEAAKAIAALRLQGWNGYGK
jgi:hypothetical protein